MLFLIKRSAMKNNNQKCCLQVLGGCVVWLTSDSSRSRFSSSPAIFRRMTSSFFLCRWTHVLPTTNRSMEPIEMERSRGDVHFLLVSAIGHGKTLDASWSAADADGRQTRSPSARRDALWRHSKKKTCHLLSPILLKLLCSIRQGHSKTFDICKQTGGKVLFFFLLLIAADGQLLSLNGDDVRHYRLTVTNVNLQKSATRHEGLANKKGKTGGMGQQVNNRSVSIAVRHLAIIPHCCVIIF